MSTAKFCCFRNRKIIVHTHETINPGGGQHDAGCIDKGCAYLCTSLTDGERGAALKIVAKIPPELLRAGCSLVEYDLTTGAAEGTADSLATLGRRVGRVDMYLLVGSRAEALLSLMRRRSLFDEAREAYLLSFGSSTRREEPDPDRGVYAVRLEDPPSSLLLRPEDLLTSLVFGTVYA